MTRFPFPRRTAVLLAALAVLIFLAGCAEKKVVIKPVEDLLVEAEEAWNKKRWDEAAEAYGQIRDYYPYHTQAALAQYRSAEALYRDEKYAQSLAAFETFQELHPTTPEMPKVMLRIGQCQFLLSYSIDRDQSITEEAIAALTRVTQRYPDAPEGQQASELIKKAYRKLVRHELYVARFYTKKGAYKAALGRLEKAMTYPEVGYGQVLTAEHARVEALAAGQKVKVKVPPDPKEDDDKWWKIWE